MQNTAVQFLTAVRTRDHIHPIYWILVLLRVHFKIILFVFKSLNGLTLPYLSELLHPNAPAGFLRSADQLEVQWFKKKLYRAFSAASPKLWNDLGLGLFYEL